MEIALSQLLPRREAVTQTNALKTIKYAVQRPLESEWTQTETSPRPLCAEMGLGWEHRPLGDDGAVHHEWDPLFLCPEEGRGPASVP